MKKSTLIKYINENYFDNDHRKFSQTTGCPTAQIKSWKNGQVKPTDNTINYIFNCIFTPEFKVIVEFAEFDSERPIKTQLRQILNPHQNDSGLYAFYDSMANLIYLGKATKLLEESYDAIHRKVHIRFPGGINRVPGKRHELIKYISYYQVQLFRDFDYPKHVESLILRISKPILNKNIGGLEQAYEKNRD